MTVEVGLGKMAEEVMSVYACISNRTQGLGKWQNKEVILMKNLKAKFSDHTVGVVHCLLRYM